MIVDLLQKVLLSTVLGAVLGFERQYSKKQDVIGLRTFSLIALLGSMSVIVSQQLNNSFFAVISFVFVCAYSIYLFFKSKKRRTGFTTNVSIILTFLIGTLVGLDFVFEPIFLTVVIAVVLFSKERLHKIIQHLNEKEVTDSLEFLILLGIVYPLIPAEFYIRGIEIPLMSIWYLVVIVSVINFLMFVTSRHLKSKYGIEIISFISGFVSSTALMIYLSNTFKPKLKDGLKKLVVGSNSATLAMFLRNALFVAVLFPAIIEQIWIPLLLVFASIIFLTLAIYRNLCFSCKDSVEIKSPFNVMEAARMGFAILVFIILINLIQTLGPQLFYATSFLGGLVSSLSFTLSLITLLISGKVSIAAAPTAIILASLGSLTSSLAVFVLKKNWAFFKKNLPVIAAVYILPVLYLLLF